MTSMIFISVASSIMSDEETVHQYSKRTIRSKRKNISGQTGGKKMVSRTENKLRMPALEIINDKIYAEGLEKKTALLVGPKIKVSYKLGTQ